MIIVTCRETPNHGNPRRCPSVMSTVMSTVMSVMSTVMFAPRGSFNYIDIYSGDDLCVSLSSGQPTHLMCHASQGALCYDELATSPPSHPQPRVDVALRHQRDQL